jgi:clan AA aspartic protease
MGKVMNHIKLTNATDLDMAERGLIAREQVRTETVEALVDSGAIMLALPEDLVAKLGFPTIEMRRAKMANGAIHEVPCVGNVRFEVLGRQMTCGALVLPAGTTPLIGQLQLEELDLIIDAKNREVRVNPASPDIVTVELLRAG